MVGEKGAEGYRGANPFGIGAGERLLNDDFRGLGGLLGYGLLDVVPGFIGNGAIGLGVFAVRVRNDDGSAGIRGFADVHMEGNFAEEVHAQLIGFGPGAAVAENFGALTTVGAGEIAHVFNQTEHRHGKELEEISRMLGGIEITRETRAHAADMLKRAGN